MLDFMPAPVLAGAEILPVDAVHERRMGACGSVIHLRLTMGLQWEYRIEGRNHEVEFEETGLSESTETGRHQFSSPSLSIHLKASSNPNTTKA